MVQLHHNCLLTVIWTVFSRRVADARAAASDLQLGMYLSSSIDNAPAHHTCDTVELLILETPKFISPDMWPANSCDLNPIDC